MRSMARDGREVNIDHFSNGIVVNSNFRFDWAQTVDLGHTDRCRFYTDGTANLFVRVFRLNPPSDGTRDRHGAEVAFRIERVLKEKFLDAYRRDIDENFLNVQQ